MSDWETEVLGALGDIMDGKADMSAEDPDPDEGADLAVTETPTIRPDTTMDLLTDDGDVDDLQPDDADDTDVDDDETEPLDPAAVESDVPLAGQDGAGDETGPPSSSSSAPVNSAPSLDRLLALRLGREPTEDEVRVAYQALSSGLGDQTPASSASPAPAAQTYQAPPQPQLPSDLPQLPEHYRDDPELAAYHAQVSQTYGQTADAYTQTQIAQQRQAAAQAAEEWNRRVSDAEAAARVQLHKDYPDLAPEHYIRIEQRAIESQRFPTHVRAYPNDLTQAVLRTYRDAVGDLPDVGAEILAKASARQTIEDERAATRKKKAGQAASGASKGAGPPPKPRTPEEADSQLLDEIRSAMSG